MKRIPLLCSTIVSTTLALAQCPAPASTVCEVAVPANAIEVSGTQSLSGASQCFLIPAGASLDYVGAYSVFLVETGGSVNANGTSNLVIAKSGASVGFCGSGYANQVNHAGATLSCMTGNAQVVCTDVVFTFPTAISDLGEVPEVWFDEASRSLHVRGYHAGRAIELWDAAGRRASPTGGARGIFELGHLAPGVYVVRSGSEGPVHRFLLP
ncbi:MAG: hypothetical protein IPK70_11590 [Flavobacteriales bacterium]|jgi:hypothetical protein|nr:hypothetical protein [Flavobacteriales bacterium]